MLIKKLSHAITVNRNVVEDVKGISERNERMTAGFLLFLAIHVTIAVCFFARAAFQKWKNVLNVSCGLVASVIQRTVGVREVSVLMRDKLYLYLSRENVKNHFAMIA